ncbi:hypothetical protein GQX73_g1466 [Xylaria multiplex]|uniref:Protein BNI4 n=1 Tax=Xylaria multiplex TaxID=323545 RepID=A0A7C8MXX2_9PEZI|nr:hypothetical protein GQX73_g1466 [Xylaria multiplex]
MAALVQTYPQQSGTVTLLQTAPGSATGIMPGTSQGHAGQAYGNPQRNAYHGSIGSVGGQTGYRSGTVAPIQPYAFTSTPSLGNSAQMPQHGGYRTSSGTTVPTLPQLVDARMQPSMSAARPQLNATSIQPTFAQVAASKASPERYRRPAPRQVDSPSVIQSQQIQGSVVQPVSGVPTPAQLYNNPRTTPRGQGIVANRPQSAHGALTSATMDDMHLYRHPTDDESKKYRRRSIHSINSSDYLNSFAPENFKRTTEQFQPDVLTGSKKQGGTEKEQKPARVVPLPPPANNASHVRNGSSESIVSSRSSHSRPSSSANRNSNASAPTGSPASTSSLSGEKVPAHDQPKAVNIPPRGSSTDVGKRVLSPSPLSNPVNMASESSANKGASATVSSPTKPPTSSQGPKTESPAAKQLAAINEKGAKAKTKTSRLRRAFSFGSAAELRKVTGQDIGVESATTKHDEPSRLHKDPRAEDLYEQEQARIAQKQEEGGIGSSIYSGTKLFSGSTDNLSISSTASSASIMLRKMGRGMKKGSRSLVGLFRPKSMIGSPNEEATVPEASQAAVSMVTVEAERDRVNVTTNAELTQTTGTGFPHLERNSIDATKNPESLNSDRLDTSSENSAARKSIVGGERERAEVLATIRKGILKTRSNSPTPPTAGSESKGPTFDLPAIPNVSDSPYSSAPSTPNDEVQGHKRNGSIAIGNEDYFMSALRLRQDSKSAPGTPQAGHKRNATFSPRIVFHDTWPSGEYDRRGEIATCNRLTPMLAQQIKEELNSFKMEMEVHETSKIYTHFF